MPGIQPHHLLKFLLPYLLGSMWLLNPCFSQDTSPLPAFHPIAEHTYGIKEGLPEDCVHQLLIDNKDRLYIKPCTAELIGTNTYLYQFDGIRTFPFTLTCKHKPLITLNGIDSSNQIYGIYFSGLNKGDRAYRGGAYMYDPPKKVLQSFYMDDYALGRIADIVSAESVFFILSKGKAGNSAEISCIQNGNISSLYRLDLKLKRARPKLAITDNDFWIVSSAPFIYRISRKDGSIHRYARPYEEKQDLESIASHQNSIWISTNRNALTKKQASIYVWKPERDSFMTNPYKPSGWKDEEIMNTWVARDLKGNVLTAYWHADHSISATLVDAHQQLFDYTPVMSKHTFFTSNNFKQNIVFHSTKLPLRFVEVTTHHAIKKVTGIHNPREMVELNPQTICLGEYQRLVYDEASWSKKPGSSCIDAAMYAQQKRESNTGHIWFNHRTTHSNPSPRLWRYDPVQELCDTFDMRLFAKRFDFMKDGRIVFATYKNLYLWDWERGSPQLLIKDVFQHAGPNQPSPNQVFVGQDEIIWIASHRGLLRVDSQTGNLIKINLVAGQTISVIRIHQDPKGRLWLGTAANGIIIFDPSSGTTQIIKKTNGLSHNTVVSLLEDQDGDIWAGTFHGITILAPDGNVIGTLYEKDGLANSECNRWSALKMKDGRLCFGAVDGVTIIDPVAWKADRDSYAPPHIYLSSIYTDSEEESEPPIDHLLSFEQNERIVLPATNRNVKITFQLSNYASQEQSTFAYQIVGIHKKWNFIGNQRQLSLNSLPAGSYDILIKGKGHRGKWSPTPIMIKLKVERFFYQQWWFFVLCTLPFITFFLLWQHRQRGERKRLEREVQHRTATIREQADKLQEVDQIKSRLYTNITHEFRTPLTVISGMSELINEDPATAKKLINRNSRGLLRLVNQMLDLAKLESGHLQVELIQADILPYIQYLFESFQSFAASKNIQLSFQKEVEEVVMDFDEKKLESIVSNLLSNAIKFTPEGGEVRLQYSVGSIQSKNPILPTANSKLQTDLLLTANCLLFTVTDTGIGISPEKLPYIFDRFYQADDSTTRKGEGTGIGLTLTRELVEMMGGTIHVQSPGPEGKGTSFTVNLPIRHEATAIQPHIDAEVLLPLPTSVENLPRPFNKASKKEELPLLLLIEDNHDVAMYIQACLKDRYTVQWAVNGALGIEKALEAIPDIIISDVMMPEKDGFEVCQTLKSDERTSHIPIVLLTAKADVDSRLEGLGVGADAYLSKPFLKEELYVRLSKLVELRRKLQAKYAGLQPSISQAPTEPTLDDLFLQKIYQLVETHLDDSDFGNEQLAQEMLLSQSQLFRKLKALTGRSVAVHIRGVRLQKGKELLQNSQLTISEVAYECGFTDPAYFSRTFSKEFGETPSSFRSS